MRRTERQNVEWETPPNDKWNWQHVQLEVLMDIRAELQKLNALLHCVNFVQIPQTLNKIEANTKRKVRKAKP